jgi:hypothetical protein
MTLQSTRTITGMDDLSSWNLTVGARVRLAVLALLVWAVGGTVDGHGLRALVAVPLLVAAWLCSIYVVDRWVITRRDRS